MSIRLCLFFSFLCMHLFVHAHQSNKKHYDLNNDPIDVVIVAHSKDKSILDYCIAGIKKNCKIRRVIVVSDKKLTNKAEWFDEKFFPFSMKDIYIEVGGGNKEDAKTFFNHHNRGPGWYLQQLLKLYSAFVIPDISSNVLVIDADVVFLNPIKFLNKQNGGLFCVYHKRPLPLYIQHAERFLPGYKRIYPEFYSVCHHMLFQRPILEDLFRVVEDYHGVPFWVAFCACVAPHFKKGASEYEIYYNFALRNTDQVEIRELFWKNSGHMELIENYRREGYDFVAFHSYLRRRIAR